MTKDEELELRVLMKVTGDLFERATKGCESISKTIDYSHNKEKPKKAYSNE